MKTRTHTVTAIIAAFVLAATGSTSLAATGNGTSSEAGRAALSVAQAKISPAQAIAAAEAKAGGKATGIDLKHKNGATYYKVETRQGKQEHKLEIDAQSGQVLNSKTKTEKDAPPQAKISLQQAIAAAEAKVGGKAIEADLEHEKGSVVYDVEVLAANGTKHDVKVNADNGQVISSKVDHPD